MNRSAAKFRSANWLLKNIPTIAANGNAFKISDCSEKNQAMLSGSSESSGAGGGLGGKAEARKIAEDQRKPRAPDEELQDHHEPELDEVR